MTISKIRLFLRHKFIMRLVISGSVQMDFVLWDQRINVVFRWEVPTDVFEAQAFLVVEICPVSRLSPS